MKKLRVCENVATRLPRADVLQKELLRRHNLTYMEKKRDNLRRSGTWNRAPGRVKDTFFVSEAFFDPEDLVQVKYEMLRRVSHEGLSISEAARLFGFSRPSFYAAQAALEQEGLSGLIAKKPGPRARHKLTDEVLEVLMRAQESDRSLNSASLAKILKAKCNITVHPRSIERALKFKKNSNAKRHDDKRFYR